MIEVLRLQYKPDKVKVLFIGESAPAGGTFFYLENSNLYNYTKQSFQAALGIRFNCKVFQSHGCWLYDVCDLPVNNLSDTERNESIRKGIPKLIGLIKELDPVYLIIVKKGNLQKNLLTPLTEAGYRENEKSFFLPFPSCGQQQRYVKQLTHLLRNISSVF